MGVKLAKSALVVSILRRRRGRGRKAVQRFGDPAALSLRIGWSVTRSTERLSGGGTRRTSVRRWLRRLLRAVRGLRDFLVIVSRDLCT